MERVSLVQLRAQQKGRVAEIQAGLALSRRFMSMGIYVGRDLIKLNQCALRGPVTIRVGRSVLALGHSMAKKILVDVTA